MARIAFLTISLLQKPPDDPQMQGFFQRAPAVLQAAQQQAGFIDMLPDPDWKQWQCPAIFQPDVASGRLSVTLSLWQNLESVFAFAYNGLHAEALRKRREWFPALVAPPYAAWWIADDHILTWEEATDRFESLQHNGPTAQVFDFKHPFDANGQPFRLNPKSDRPEE